MIGGTPFRRMGIGARSGRMGLGLTPGRALGVSLAALALATTTVTGTSYEVGSDRDLYGAFAANEPAITNDGQVIRSAWQNRFLRSQEFDNATWSKTGCAVTPNTTTAPDGTTTAETLTENTASTSHVIQQSVTMATGLSTYAIFAKRLSGTRFLQFRPAGIGFGKFYASYDFTTEQASVGGSEAVGARMVKMTDGWYRLTVVANCASAPTGIQLYMVNSHAEAQTYTADGSGSFAIWGAVAANGSDLTGGPYVPTTTAVDARGEDRTSGTFAFNPAQEAIVWAKVRPLSVGATQSVFHLYEDANNSVAAKITSDGRVSLAVRTGGVTTTGQTTAGLVTSGAPYWIGIHIDPAGDTTALLYDETTLTTVVVAATVPATLSTAYLGNVQGGGEALRGITSTLYAKAGTYATDAALIAGLTQAPTQTRATVTSALSGAAIIGILLGGQSNMEGASEDDGGANYPVRVKQFNGTSIVDATFAMQHPNTTNGLSFGVDLQGIIDLQAAYPNADIVVIPAARSSTGFSNGFWNPGDSSYEELVRRTRQFLRQYPNAALGGFWWHQGESDAGLGSGYATVFDAMLADFRGKFGSIPTVVGGLAPEFYNASTNRQNVQAAIEDAPNRHANLAYAGSDGLLTTDNTHFDAASARTLGSRYFTAWDALVSA